jgi:hypothetical protein
MAVRSVTGETKTKALAENLLRVCVFYPFIFEVELGSYSDKPIFIDEIEPRLITSPTQTDDTDVNMVTTRSAARKQRCLPDASRPSSSHSPSLISTNPSRPSPSRCPWPDHRSAHSHRSVNNSPAFFDDATWNTHQNQGTTICEIKTIQPLKPTFVLDDFGVLCKIVSRKSNSSLSLSLVHPPFADPQSLVCLS